LDGALGFERRDLGAFGGDPGDDGNLCLDRLHKAFDDRGLLVRCEEGSLPGMTENDQTFDLLEAAKPGAEPPDRGVVNLAVASKRGHGRGDETSEIKGFHVGYLMLCRARDCESDVAGLRRTWCLRCALRCRPRAGGDDSNKVSRPHFAVCFSHLITES